MSNRNGSKWIRPDKRLRIYARDWFKCQYPGCMAVLTGLTLDHLTARKDGGSNHAHNLITACSRHNSSRGNKPLRDVVGKEAAREMRKQARRSLPPVEQVTERRKLIVRL